MKEDISLGSRECIRLLTCSFLGAVFFECCWWSTGGGYYCSVPIFLALSCYCYGKQLLSLSIPGELASNIKTNVAALCRQEKRSILLILSYFATKVGLTIAHPKGEESNGTPLSLIVFTILFICIFLVPSLLKIVWSLLKSVITCCTRSSPSSASLQEHQKSDLYFHHKSAFAWKKSVLVCAALVLGSYLLDSNLTAMVRFLGKGRPCWPLLLPKDKSTVPSNILNVYSWHTMFPDYKPYALVKRLILIGRELGEVCHLLPMLIGTYVLSHIFLPPKNSLIKSALFASIAGVVIGGATSASLKILFHRYRPNAYGDPYMWKGPGMATVNHLQFSKLDLSFPAGHTTVTSAVATCWYAFIMLNLRQLCVSPCINLLILFCLYIHPVFVLLSRVSECYHWTSDATFGVS